MSSQQTRRHTWSHARCFPRESSCLVPLGGMCEACCPIVCFEVWFRRGAKKLLIEKKKSAKGRGESSAACVWFVSLEMCCCLEEATPLCVESTTTFQKRKADWLGLFFFFSFLLFFFLFHFACTFNHRQPCVQTLRTNRQSKQTKQADSSTGPKQHATTNQQQKQERQQEQQQQERNSRYKHAHADECPFLLALLMVRIITTMTVAWRQGLCPAGE